MALPKDSRQMEQSSIDLTMRKKPHSSALNQSEALHSEHPSKDDNMLSMSDLLSLFPRPNSQSSRILSPLNEGRPSPVVVHTSDMVAGENDTMKKMRLSVGACFEAHDDIELRWIGRYGRPRPHGLKRDHSNVAQNSVVKAKIGIWNGSQGSSISIDTDQAEQKYSPCASSTLLEPKKGVVSEASGENFHDQVMHNLNIGLPPFPPDQRSRHLEGSRAAGKLGLALFENAVTPLRHHILNSSDRRMPPML
ncbi:hypothetical protein LTR17_024898 [Elasticomyces elasticus]|nr:hypothetical protein LTR17_024898 [Elasticomyces elasticus]